MQSSVGTADDGVMTSVLLGRLFLERGLKEFPNQGSDFVSGAAKDDTNKTPTASVSEIKEIKETVIKETGDVEVEISAHRVFLLGENRWEEPSRLKIRDKPISGSKAVPVDIPCLRCRGEGQLLCTECDGSGEPNIEPQFLEWFGENAKCPYCKGLGYTTCDVCEGKAVAIQI